MTLQEESTVNKMRYDKHLTQGYCNEKIKE